MRFAVAVWAADADDEEKRRTIVAESKENEDSDAPPPRPEVDDETASVSSEFNMRAEALDAALGEEARKAEEDRAARRTRQRRG